MRGRVELEGRKRERLPQSCMPGSVTNLNKEDINFKIINRELLHQKYYEKTIYENKKTRDTEYRWVYY